MGVLGALSSFRKEKQNPGVVWRPGHEQSTTLNVTSVFFTTAHFYSYFLYTMVWLPSDPQPHTPSGKLVLAGFVNEG